MVSLAPEGGIKMFDKLIESDTAGAEFKNRSRYFTVSTIIVGILFLTAVVYSLYASEVGLGNVNFDVSELVAPLEATEPEAQPSRVTQPNTGDHSTTKPNINSDMAGVDEPTIVPTGVSADRNTRPSRSWKPFDPRLPESNGIWSPIDGGSAGEKPTGTRSDTRDDIEEAGTKTTEPPPPAIKKPTIMRTSKVFNGDAISLPKPAYPQPAVMLNLQGSVRVQVTIDETGKVVSAKAADGHPFFRMASEQAARNARFKPTLLNDVPVKVTGLIVYNFKRN